MSNFRSKAFNPASKRVEDAEYCDNYYGRHRYGIRFDDGCVHPEAQCGIDAAAAAIDALSARVKELEEEQVALVRDHQSINRQLLDEMRRATRLQQERDEAYERAARTAHHWSIASNIRLHAGEMTAQEMRTAQAIACGIEAAIRRLASGPEKRGK